MGKFKNTKILKTNVKTLQRHQSATNFEKCKLHKVFHFHLF